MIFILPDISCCFFFLLWIPRIASERNRAVYTRVPESLYCDYGGKEQCPWTIAQFYFASGVSKVREMKSKAESLEAWLALTIGSDVFKPIGCHCI